MNWFKHMVWVGLLLAACAGFGAYYAKSKASDTAMSITHQLHVTRSAQIKQDLESGDMDSAIRLNDKNLKMHYELLEEMHDRGQLHDIPGDQYDEVMSLAREVGVDRIE